MNDEVSKTSEQSRYENLAKFVDFVSGYERIVEHFAEGGVVAFPSKDSER